MSFSERLKAVIKRSGLKREAFAESVGKSRSQLFNYLSGEQNPTADFFQAVKSAFPWVNIEWLITGIGEMEARSSGVQQVATGNGHIQVGGSVNGQVVGGQGNRVTTGKGTRIGGVHTGREMITVEEGEAIWQSNDRDLVELIALLRDYGTPKMLAELRDKLLQIKRAVEGE